MSKAWNRWIPLLTTIVFLSGCGASWQSTNTSQPTPPTQLPQQPPPQSPPPVPQQEGSVTVSPGYAALSPGHTRKFVAVANGGGSIVWSVNQIAGGNASVGTIDSSGNYTAPSVPLSRNVVVMAALSSSPQANYATATVAVIVSGQFTPTANPQVVAYSIYLPAPGTVSIEFGPAIPEQFATWSQPTPSTYGGMVQIYVAGMLANTLYHMHAVVKLDNGTSFQDSDHAFTTGTPPNAGTLEMTTLAGQTPQRGIELFDTIIPAKNQTSQAFATDLQGNVLWTYTYQGSNLDVVQPIQPLPTGHFLLLISFASSLPASTFANLPSGTIDVIREIDLAGNTIRELSLASLTQSLASLGYNFNLKGFHHDVLPLPNGHLILLANLTETFNNLPGYPGTTDVLGDVLVDVDQNFKPTWVWNTFDHLDVNRHPMLFPDWTHANALLYSADDHNLLLSMRHQNWVVKIDYQDGQGTGNILWRLGPGGDFKLVGGTDPTDWFWAQHGPSYFTPNTTGVFQLGIMDNGTDRQFAPGVTCDSAGGPPCHYSTAPVFQIDETAMTATILSRYNPSPPVYSFFGGNTNLLPDGHIGVDFCAQTGGSLIQEIDESAGATQVVWQASTPGSSQYRAYRLPSLYPGVQW